MVPVMSFPSQCRSSRRRFGLLAGPHCPLHCPFNGWPNCARAIAGSDRISAATAARRSARMTISLAGTTRRPFLTGLSTWTKDRLAEIIFQTIQVPVVLLADVLGQLAVATP